MTDLHALSAEEHNESVLRAARINAELRDRAEAAEARCAELEKERDELRQLVTEAYDEWGDDGYPTNMWRVKAERLGAWPAAALQEETP